MVFDEDQAFPHIEIVRYVNGLIYGGVPTFLSVPGPPGHLSAKAFLNDLLRAEVSRNDGTGISAKLKQILQILKNGEFEPIVFDPVTTQVRPDRMLQHTRSPEQAEP